MISASFISFTGEGCFHQSSREVLRVCLPGQRTAVRYRTELFDSHSQFLLCRCMAS